MKEQMIELINSLPDSDKHIYKDYQYVTITSEWLVGNFVGRGFSSKTLEQSADDLIKYFNENLNGDSIVGSILRKSGYPNLSKVKKYIETEK